MFFLYEDVDPSPFCWIPSRSRQIRTLNILIQTLMRNPNSISQLLCQLRTLKMGRQPSEFAWDKRKRNKNRKRQ
ncbi:hypothetical protein RHMOL_Rhmol08G0251700 [Rhododendron molle]|uniref:Uncharacterized protein n=2 Tax=Rhododendron molle TaxID=49168 RepID=A0ACC0MT81_RHOML|nr:hypothetical protein RHMOL_Rhmol08G0251700 [Rhododendron molle]KAI8543859.1 hypothetical protein RHMOL_Rhmol08G0251700 [Rhododendron molle]